MEMRIKLTSPLICKKHSVLLQNKYRKKDYTSEKNESLQMNHDFNQMGTPSDEPSTNFENDNSFGIGGFETDFSESGLPIDDNIEDISSNSESEMEEFPYQIVPKSIKTQKMQNKYKRNRINHSNLLYWKQISQDLDCEVFSDYDEDSDYYEDLSNTNTTNSTTKKQIIQQNIPQIFPKKNAIKHIQIPLSIEDIKTQIQFCKDNICDFKVDLSIYNVFDPNWNNINNETPNTNYSEQPRLLYENFLKSKNLQKDLFEWKLKSNTPSVHFKDLMKILQHYHPEEKLLCTPRVIRKRMLKEIGYDNIYNYYNNNTQNKKQTNERISTIKLRWDLKSKKKVPIYDLKTRLPFISELLHLQRTKELFGKKVFIRLCSIAGDTVEQQPASGKLSHSSIEVCRHCCLSKHNEGFNLGKNIIFKDKNFDITRVNSDNDDFVIPTTRKRNSNQNNLENEMIDSTLIIQENKKKRLNGDKKQLEIIQERISIEIENDEESITSEDSQNINNESESETQDNLTLNTEVCINLYSEGIDIFSQKRNDDFLKELQKFLVLLDIQPEPEQYRIIKEKISKKHGVLLQRGNPWLHLFNFKSYSFYHFTICWVHLLLEGLFKDGLLIVKNIIR
ncbi:hypothetical protein M0812_19772 [Anaeramoeba flamelloides]|uniref:Uncharacterized protein n=1 Tax=Anaeramoeba flamelloides TaxID=1746091 RepID=A0AAV7Z588_9EUKA|nr:hypothetical protein M0812_19772 [Anaeramoeba flamelloides]